MTYPDGTPVLEHDARCPEIAEPMIEPDPRRCTCRDQQGRTPSDGVVASWADGPLCAFDLETTGPDPLEARIVTATVVRIRPGRDKVVTDWLSDVDGEEIPAGAAAVHGVTTERAHAEGRPHREVLGEIVTALALEWATGVPVIGHNVSYDFTVVAQECLRSGLDPFQVAGPVIDTIVLDRGVDKYRKGKRTLTASAQVYGVALSEEDAHSSAADALASARIAWKIARRYPDVGSMPLHELQGWQADKHRTWADGFGAYLTKQGKTDDVSREWPLRGAS